MRARSALLCAVLLIALTAGRHPQAFLGRIGMTHLESRRTSPRLPLETLLHDAQVAEDSGYAAKAARLQELVCIQYPDHPAAEEARLHLGRDLAAQGDHAGAARAFQKFRVLYPESPLLPEGLLDVAGWQCASGDYLGAARSYTDLIALVTRSVPQGRPSEDASPPLPTSRRAARQQEDAEHNLERLERLARFNQAVCFERGGNRSAAVRAYERFMSRFPEDARVPEAHFQMATLLLESGDLNLAVQHFRAVWESPESSPQFRSESIYRAGRGFESLRCTDEAIRTFRLASELRPGNDEFRLASLAELALLIQDRQPLQAVNIYRDIAEYSKRPAWRAAALEHLVSLENEPTVADAGR